jgi:hypothetical protein
MCVLVLVGDKFEEDKTGIGKVEWAVSTSYCAWHTLGGRWVGGVGLWSLWQAKSLGGERARC